MSVYDIKEQLNAILCPSASLLIVFFVCRFKGERNIAPPLFCQRKLNTVLQGIQRTTFEFGSKYFFYYYLTAWSSLSLPPRGSSCVDSHGITLRWNSTGHFIKAMLSWEKGKQISGALISVSVVWATGQSMYAAHSNWMLVIHNGSA